MPGMLPEAWRLDKDGHKVEHDKRATYCWAEVQPGVFCSISTADPLGLCPRHRQEILGPAKGGP